MLLLLLPPLPPLLRLAVMLLPPLLGLLLHPQAAVFICIRFCCAIFVFDSTRSSSVTVAAAAAVADFSLPRLCCVGALTSSSRAMFFQQFIPREHHNHLAREDAANRGQQWLLPAEKRSCLAVLGALELQ